VENVGEIFFIGISEARTPDRACGNRFEGLTGFTGA